MEALNPWKLIKAGFWVGIGFIVPSIVVYILGTSVVYSIPSLWQPSAAEGAMEAAQASLPDSDKSSQVKIAHVREVKNGQQLLILGQVENMGTPPVGSIRVEAELLDGNKQMVFECSEYISRKLKTGEKENFQIKCGCNNQPVPQYATVSVRVVSAHDF